MNSGALAQGLDSPPLRIALLARSLDYGGAETQMALLAQGLARRGHAVEVVLFYPEGEWVGRLRGAGIAVRSLDKAGRWDLIGFGRRLIRTLRAFRPHILNSFLTPPNVLAALLKPFLPGTCIVWGIRASNMDLGRYDWTRAATAAIERRLAACANAIVCNAQAGRDYALGLGFPAGRMSVVPNGIDTERFRPDAEARRRLRSEFGLTEDDIAIGTVGRIEPMKGYDTLLEAFARIAPAHPRARLVCVGPDLAPFGDAIRARGAALGLGRRVIWAGPRRDVEAVYNAFDRFVLASRYGEGFSNVVAEAMASGHCPVATDVGDSAVLVRGHGIVVPAEDPAALADALERSLAQPGDGAAARAAILARYSIETMVEGTLAEYRRALAA